MRTIVTIGGETVIVEVARAADAITATVDGTALHAEVQCEGERWRITVADHTLTALVVRERDQVWIALEGEVYRCAARPEERAAAATGGARSPHVTAPMPGKVLEVRVHAGQEVAAGDPLVVLEAMKMETVASAEAAARVLKVLVQPGSMVEPGQTLVELEFPERA